MNSNPLLGAVVERAPSAVTTGLFAPSARADEVLQSGMTRRQAIRACRATLPDGRAEIDAYLAERAATAKQIAPPSSGAVTKSQFGRASLKKRAELGARFPIEGAQEDPVYRSMAQPSEEGESLSQSAVAGIEFDLLLERDLWDADGNGLSRVRVFEARHWDERLGNGGAPVANSLLDERMGVVRRPPYACPVCDGYKDEDQYKNPRPGEPAMCTGHFGHIVLPGACFHPLTVTHVRSMLRSFCWHCGDLPGTDEQNIAAVITMRATCPTRPEKLRFLDKKFRDVKHCAQCAQKRRCRKCPAPRPARDGEPAKTQCDKCASFVYFRPLVRTHKQALNETDRLRERIINEAGYDQVDEDLRRAARGKNYSGFPYEAILNGHEGTSTVEYKRFAKEVYGEFSDYTTLPLHGERVRAVIAQMSDAYLSLFYNHSFESPHDVRDWFRAMVPRLVPVAPNPVRPTDVGGRGSNSGDIRLNDLTKRYDKLLERCINISHQLDTAREAPANDPMLFFSSHDIFSSPVNAWFRSRHVIDWDLIDLYGELQYFYASVLDDNAALNFLPTAASAHGIGRTAQARRRNKLEEAGSRRGNDNQAGAMVASFAKRLHGKEGRVRGNLQGKRVENAGRSVITPDHRMSIREVRIPYQMAARLYVRERVNAYNVDAIVARAERSRVGDVAKKPHAGCAGCAHCEEIVLNEETQLCMWNALGDQRIAITGGRDALKVPVGEHPFATEVGAVIERTLRGGDLVLMNRQPSLHKHSTQVHTVRIAHDLSIGLNELATDPYNADFDGDEMNVHVISGDMAMAEAQELMSVEKQLVSAQNSATLHGLKQDAATGMYLLTSPDTFLEHGDVCNIMMSADQMYHDEGWQIPEPAIRVRRADGSWRSLWTGVQMANFALPQSAPRLNYKKPLGFQLDSQRLNHPRGGITNRTELPVLIENGVLLMGRISKSVAGASASSITSAILMRSGAARGTSEIDAVNFIDRCAWLASEFLTIRGFSVGVADCLPPDYSTTRETDARIRKAAAVAEREIHKLLHNNAELLVKGKHADRVTAIEEPIMGIESSVVASVGEIVELAVPPDNAFNTMMRAGGKGGPTNLHQIMGVLGGQQREGRRVVDTYMGMKYTGQGDGRAAASALSAGANGEVTQGGTASKARKTPIRALLNKPISTRLLDNIMTRRDVHESRGQYPGAAAGGFIDRSFVDGLTPRQFWNHAMAGREGLIDTACKTADTGDAQRLATKSCEGIAVRYDNTVRTETNQIVTTRYGGNNYRATELKTKELPFIGMNAAALNRSMFYAANDIVRQYDYVVNNQDINAVLDENARLNKQLLELRTMSSMRNSKCCISTPNDLQSVIVDVLALYNEQHKASWSTLDDRSITWDLTDARAQTRIDFERKKNPTVNEPVSAADAARIVDHYCRRWADELDIADTIVDAEVRFRLCSKQVVRRLKLTREQLTHILESYEDCLQQAIVVPNDSVGILMVQSMGQPATQMTLNTFHFTGKRQMGVVSGVPRMKEISQATSSAKMKGLKVVLPLRSGLLLVSGQRNLSDSIIKDLISPGALDAAQRGEPLSSDASRPHFSVAHQALLGRIMQQPRGTQTSGTLEQQALLIAESTEKTSQNKRASASAPLNAQQRTDVMFATIDRHFSAQDEPTDDNDPSTLRTMQTLLHSWSVVTVEKLQQRASDRWIDGADSLLQRAHSVLHARVRDEHATATSGRLLAESVWRAALCVFGTDVKYVVLPRFADAEDGHASEIAIVALDCSETYETKLYDHVRLNRHQIFVDLLLSRHQVTNERAIELSYVALAANMYETPNIYAADVDETHGESERETELMRRKNGELTAAQTRHLFKNLVSTRFVDVVENLGLHYEPIRSRDDGSFYVDTALENGRSLANETEIRALENFYVDDCFSVFDVGCQREECVEARNNADDERHADASVGCLSSFVLVCRLSCDWFKRNSVSPEAVQCAVERFLGPFYSVMIGDINSEDYIPLRVRVFTCQVDAALDTLNTKELIDLDTFDTTHTARDAIVLDRVRWHLLEFRFCGPRHGSVVMCEEKLTQLFTEEKGLEHINETVLVSNSSDLYYLLGLRGIDTRRVYTNSPHDALGVWGVEAARATAMNEYEAVMKDSASVVHRVHYALRAEVQTRNGGFLPLSIAGLRSAPNDPCQSASHRETATMFVDAAMHQRRTAPLTSPSACVMMAVPTRHIGTGGMNVMLDHEALIRDTVHVPLEPGDVLRAVNAAEEERLLAEFRSMSELNFAPVTQIPNFVGSDGDDYMPDALDEYVPYPEYAEGARFSPVHSDVDDSDSDDEPLTTSFAAVRVGPTNESVIAAFLQQNESCSDSDTSDDSESAMDYPTEASATAPETLPMFVDYSDDDDIEDKILVPPPRGKLSQPGYRPQNFGSPFANDDGQQQWAAELAARRQHTSLSARIKTNIEASVMLNQGEIVPYDPLAPELFNDIRAPVPEYDPSQPAMEPVSFDLDELNALASKFGTTDTFYDVDLSARKGSRRIKF